MIIMVIILFFSIKDLNLYVPVVTLWARENLKLSKLVSKGFERSVYWKEYKTKSENKNTANEYRYFLKSNFVGVNRLFVLVYTNQATNAKSCKAKRYYLPKSIIKYFLKVKQKCFYKKLYIKAWYSSKSL